MQRLTTTILIVLMTFALSTSASAKSKSGSASLIQDAPKDSKLAIGINMGIVRKSPLFGEFMTWLKANSTGDMGDVLFKDGVMDLNTIDSVLITLPVSQPDQTGAQKEVTVIASGKFDQAQFKAALEKRHPNLQTKKNKKRTIFVTNEFDVGFLSKSKVLFTGGSDSYRKAAWATSSKTSLKSNKDITGLMKSIDTQKGLWLTANLKGVPQAPGSPEMNGAAMKLDITKGLEFELVARLKKAEDAAAARTQVDGMKSQAASNPMLAMMGLGPFVTNLNATNRKSDLRITSHLNEPELRDLITKVSALAKQQAGAGGMPMQAPPASSMPAGPKADFN